MPLSTVFVEKRTGTGGEHEPNTGRGQRWKTLIEMHKMRAITPMT